MSLNNPFSFLRDAVNAAFGTLANPVRVQGVGTQDVAITGLIYQTSGTVMDAAGNILTVKHSTPANIAASQTDSQIVAAVANRKLRVLSVYAVVGATATNLTFNSKGGGAGTAISPLLANGANGGEVLPHNPHGWFETASGEALTATTGAGATTGLQVNYVEVS